MINKCTNKSHFHLLHGYLLSLVKKCKNIYKWSLPENRDKVLEKAKENTHKTKVTKKCYKKNWYIPIIYKTDDTVHTRTNPVLTGDS